jgi:cyclopropane fatty-acyl-phospholipid synthase-like methyltransferase
MSVSFIKFIRLGSDLWRVQKNPWVALFLRTLGTLDIHARIRNVHVINHLANTNLNHKLILDLGSGRGYLLFFLAHQFPEGCFEGIELDAGIVNQCEQAAKKAGLFNLNFNQGTYQELPDQPIYNLIISIDVLEHVQDDDGMLQKIAKILKPGGTALIHVPLRHQLQRRIFPSFQSHVVDDHVRDEYLPSEITEKAVGAGLVVEKVNYGFGYLGELAFELNNLFWDHKPLRIITSLVTFPISMVLGYIDTKKNLSQGNSIVIVASRPN